MRTQRPFSIFHQGCDRAERRGIVDLRHRQLPSQQLPSRDLSAAPLFMTQWQTIQ
ncbi:MULTISPECIES: hypothetical protein [unclassified Thiocapsa]|uniref:hypothetical protein n=1 Tax=unclassified Thiocapsa TaxID=2641286 RepID=UPI0035B3221C